MHAPESCRIAESQYRTAKIACQSSQVANAAAHKKKKIAKAVCMRELEAIVTACTSAVAAARVLLDTGVLIMTVADTLPAAAGVLIAATGVVLATNVVSATGVLITAGVWFAAGVVGARRRGVAVTSADAL